MPKKSTSSVRVFYPKFSREEVIQELRKSLGELEKRLPCTLVVLFGSYAGGNYTAASDVDLLVVYQGEENDHAYATVKGVFRIPRLEPHVYSEHEYNEMKTQIKKMISGGIIIYEKKEDDRLQ